MVPAYFAAKAHVIFRHPDLVQRLRVHVSKRIATHALFSAIHGKVAVIVGQRITRRDAAVPADHVDRELEVA